MARPSEGSSRGGPFCGSPLLVGEQGWPVWCPLCWGGPRWSHRSSLRAVGMGDGEEWEALGVSGQPERDAAQVTADPGGCRQRMEELVHEAWGGS